MPLSKHTRKQTGRVAGKKASNMKSSSPQAKVVVKSSNHQKPHQASPEPKQPQFDSGYFDGSDGEHYDAAGGDTFQYKFSNNKDWELFAGEPVANQDDDYYFDEEDAVDIASTKANHGSIYNGKNNENNTLIATQSNRPALEIIHQNPQGSDPPHLFSYHPSTQYGTTPLTTWKHTYEQHESIAYSFQQPPCPSHIFRDLQSWPEDIDLDVYAVPF